VQFDGQLFLSKLEENIMKLFFWITIIVGLCQSFCVEADDVHINIKMEMLDLGELPTGRLSKINIWYPQGTCENLTGKKLCLAESSITDKAIIFSHGAMGSAIEYSWIGEALASAGYIVIGVNHFGESWVYGQETINVRNTGLIWQRPQDISALLDHLSAQNIFQKNINWSNIIVVGHSAGGQTAAMLAGATFDLKKIIVYCDSEESKGDHSCNYGNNKENIPEAFLKKFSEVQQDARIKMIILLDPALGTAVQPESLRAIKLPTFIVGAKNNDFLPWNNHGQRYASEISNASTKLLTGQEGHFVFLSPCDNNIKVMDIPLCEDRAGVDRKAIQEELSKNILEFISDNKQVFTVQPPTIIPVKQYPKSHGILQIILYTPHWVFGLLLVLIVFGLLQTRTRQVRIQMALIMPAVMLLLSFTGVLRYVGPQIPALFCWLLGIAATTVVSIKLIGKNSAQFDVTTRKLIIQGSWIPLCVILAIFITRYALGVATAMDLNIVHAPHFPISVSLILGALSGFFLARGIIFWQMTRQ
jgi:predicted dienelactone hydrolase